MEKYTIVKLKPNEYKAVSKYDIDPIIGTQPINGLIITKDGSNIPIITSFPVDSNCEIEVRYKENGVGRIKYLSNTPRRKYYKFLTWYIFILQIVSVLFMIYEVNLGNYAVEGSRSQQLIGPALGSWLCFNIILFRNTKGFHKWFFTIFGYFLLFFFSIAFISYLIEII